MSTNKHKLNREQKKAVTFGKGPLIIIAGAGTGKTTVITERVVHLVKKNLARPSEILALTFTEKAANEMQERVDIAMPYGYTDMWISTFHGFCDRVLRDEALAIGLSPAYSLLTTSEAVQLMRKHIFDFELEYFRPVGNPTKFIQGMLSHFSRLQDEDIAPSDYVAWVNSQFSIFNFQKNKYKEQKLELEKWRELALAYKKYDELKATENHMDFGDLIVKTIELFRRRPNVLAQYQQKFKYLLIDEFQDTNYAQFELAMLLAGKAANITVVGDDDQCLPPKAKISTPDGIKQIKDINAGDKVLTAVGRGHLSTSEVLCVNKTNKRARFLSITTESGTSVKVTDNHKMFCMVPGKKLGPSNVYYVYLMYRQNMGWRLGITDDLAQRLKLERSADKILAVKSCSSLQEARFVETIYSMKYQIPTYPFKPRKHMVLTDEWLKKLSSEFDTEAGARELARDLGIDLASYHYRLDAVVRGGSERLKVLVGMCARKYKAKNASGRIVSPPQVCHVVNLETSSEKVKNILRRKRIPFEKARKGIRIRKQFADLLQANSFAIKIANLIKGHVEVRFNLGRVEGRSRPTLIMPASNVLVGMHIPVKKGSEVDYERVVDVKEKVETMDVYDLEVNRTHNFIADNVVVHNSIYRFRGAAISNILQFRKRFRAASSVVLTQNYRTHQEILDSAYSLIQYNNPDRLEVAENINKQLVSKRGKGGEIKFLHTKTSEAEAEAVADEIIKLVEAKHYNYQDFAILVRANSQADVFVATLGRLGIPSQFLGPEKLFEQSEIIELVSYLKVVINPENSQAVYQVLSMPELEIDPQDIAKMLLHSRKTHTSLWEIVSDLDQALGSASEQTRSKLDNLIETVNSHISKMKNISTGRLMYEFMDKNGVLLKLLNPVTAEAQKRAANIGLLFEKIKKYESTHVRAGVVEVVDWIELVGELGDSPRAAETDWTAENAVNILTVHSAKGLEFPVVFLVNLVHLRFPALSRRDPIPIPEELIKETLPSGDFHLQEERRLFYVGMTRARDRLYMTAADYYSNEATARARKPSQFIFEALGDNAVESRMQNVEREQLGLFAHKPAKPILHTTSSMLHIHYLSYSQIDTFRLCPLHYKLAYILKVPSLPSAALSLGNSVHNALLKFFQEIKAGSRENRGRLLALLEECWINEGYESKAHERKGFETAQKMAEDFYGKQFPLHTRPLSLEQKFNVALSKKGEEPLRIGGKIDRVDEQADGRIEIIDYKTGSAPAGGQKDIDRDLQLTFYALAATKSAEPPFGKKAKDILLTLWFLADNKKFTTVRTAEQLAAMEQEIFKTRKQIEESDFACSGHPYCERCEYKSFCRAGV